MGSDRTGLTRRDCLMGAAATGALALAPSGARAQRALKKVTVGEITRSGTSWARVVGIAKGYFAEEGVQLDTVIVQGGPPAVVQQTVAGALDIGVSNFDTIIRAIEAGAPISIIGSSMIKIPFTLISAAAVKQASDLKGKKVVVAGSPKDPTAIFLRHWLAGQNVNINDVDVLYVGAAPDRLAALINGAAAAAALTQPFDIRAMGMGFNKLADFGTMAPDYGFLGFAAQKRWLEQNGDAARGFLKAVKRASDWMHDPANKDEAIAILAKDINQEPAVVGKMYSLYFDDMKPFSRSLSIPNAYVDGVLKSMVEAKDLTPPAPPASKYLDLRHVPG